MGLNEVEALDSRLSEALCDAVYLLKHRRE